MIPEVSARDALTARLRASRCVYDAEHGGDGRDIGIAQADVQTRLNQNLVRHGMRHTWIMDERPSRGGDVLGKHQTCLVVLEVRHPIEAQATRRIPRPRALHDSTNDIDDRLALDGCETCVVPQCTGCSTGIVLVGLAMC